MVLSRWQLASTDGLEGRSRSRKCQLRTWRWKWLGLQVHYEKGHKPGQTEPRKWMAWARKWMVKNEEPEGSQKDSWVADAS